MDLARSLRFDPKVLVDYVSEQSAQVAALKGAMCLESIASLRKEGLYDEYIAELPEAHREVLANTLASTWVPVATAVAHFEIIEGMRLTESQLARLNESLGASIFQTFFAALLRSVRTAGIDAIWSGLKQSDRVMSRLYQGGGLRVTQVGPKDAVLDFVGLPLAEFRSFRVSHCAFIRGIVNLSTKTSLVRDVPSRTPRAERYSISLSWV